MEKKFKNMLGEYFSEKFEEHDISQYDILLHVTLKESKASIESEGLMRNKPTHKSLIETGLLFFSYPIDMDTSDCFRWSDKYYSLIVLDAKMLKDDGFVFFDDNFGKKDASSKRNHLCCDADIPVKYIKKIVEFND
jgi:hypothetical protein